MDFKNEDFLKSSVSSALLDELEFASEIRAPDFSFEWLQINREDNSVLNWESAKHFQNSRTWKKGYSTIVSENNQNYDNAHKLSPEKEIKERHAMLHKQ